MQNNNKTDQPASLTIIPLSICQYIVQAFKKVKILLETFLEGLQKYSELRTGLPLNPCTAQIYTQVMAPSPLMGFY